MTKEKFNIDQVSNMKLLARQLVEGFITGKHKSPNHGFSVEFAEHRLYNEGENAKYVDWKIFARTDKLYVKQYEEETNLRCLILIDSSSSMYYPSHALSKLTFSTYCAAALSHIMNKQRDAFGLCLFSNHVETLSSIKSTSTHLSHIFHMLYQQCQRENKSKKRTSIAPVLHEIAKKIHRRSLIILFSDLFDDSDLSNDLYKALQHLRHNKNEVVIFHVSDHDTEFNFNFPDTPHEFIDVETGQKIKTNPSLIHQDFNDQLAQFHKELKMKCGQLNIDFVVANIQEGYSNVLRAYLIKRSAMMRE